MSDNSQERPNWTFYFAGGYAARKSLALDARSIERSGWKCNSRWLGTQKGSVGLGAHDKMPGEQAAQEDIEDILKSGVFILSMQYDSSLGGMWVELGVALSNGKPIVLFRPVQGLALTPFLRLPGIKTVTTKGELISYLEGLRTNSERPPQLPGFPQRFTWSP